MFLIKYILNYLIKGVLYSLVTGLLGIFIGMFLNWPLLKGSYVAILVAGNIVLIVSVILLLGTPGMRKKILTSAYNRVQREDDSKISEKDVKLSGGEGIGPAFMGIVMILIGLFVENLIH
jgi:small-conductance mechanosensitive channel